MRTAVLSDIHGNRWALEAVLRDIERRGVRDIVNLGDSLYGPLDPEGTSKILLELDLPAVRGNEDRLCPEFPWLATLPKTLEMDGLFLCHGTPLRDDEYLLHEVRESGVFPRSDLAGLTASIRQATVLCGHDHIPGFVVLADGKRIVNPGSVGLPAYTDDLPHPHAMETGSPHARYGIVTEQEVERIEVDYDWDAAADRALENSRPDWARWLKTGRAGL
jgi:putative phosphoesterase